MARTTDGVVPDCDNGHVTDTVAKSPTDDENGVYSSGRTVSVYFGLFVPTAALVGVMTIVATVVAVVKPYSTASSDAVPPAKS